MYRHHAPTMMLTTAPTERIDEQNGSVASEERPGTAPAQRPGEPTGRAASGERTGTVPAHRLDEHTGRIGSMNTLIAPPTGSQQGLSWAKRRTACQAATAQRGTDPKLPQPHFLSLYKAEAAAPPRSEKPYASEKKPAAEIASSTGGRLRFWWRRRGGGGGGGGEALQEGSACPQDRLKGGAEAAAASSPARWGGSRPQAPSPGPRRLGRPGPWPWRGRGGHWPRRRPGASSALVPGRNPRWRNK